jgi:hypothetical protein
MSDDVISVAPEGVAPESVVTAPVTPEIRPRVFTQEELDAAIGKRLARERRSWEREQRVAAPPAPTEPFQELSAEQFESAEAYTEALVNQRAARLVVQREQEQQRAQVMEAHAEREEAARERFDDYDNIIQNPKLRITEVMAEVIRASDVGPDVAYYLGTNPKEADRIAQLNPFLQAKEIGKLESKVTSQPPMKKTSSAPAPIAPVRSTGGKPVGYDTTDPRSVDAMSTSEWIAAENERVRRRAEARTH